MSAAELTEWFSPYETPKVVGEYEYQYKNGYCFRVYWNGYDFLIHDSAEKLWWGHPVLASGTWRGLKHPHS